MGSEMCIRDRSSSDPHASRTTVNSGEPLEPPADHPPSVFAVSTVDPDQHTLAEHGPDLVGGKVSVDPATFTTRVALHCGPSATTPAKCVSLLDSGSPQTFIRESYSIVSAFDQRNMSNGLM